MKILNVSIITVVVLLLPMNQPVSGQPTFQVYSPGATWGDYDGDQDTWFVMESPFELDVAGAYHSTDVSLTSVRLLVSVPEGEQGTISITGLSGSGTADPTLILNGSQDLDILDPPSADDGYSRRNLFLPTISNFNNHYPIKNDVADFLVYDIGDFSDVGDPIYDWNADGGTITPTGSTGEIKEYYVEVSGFTWVHFDAYGLVTRYVDDKYVADWEMNPASHDTTFVPAPGAILLGGIGVCVIGWLRRRRTL